MEKLHAVIKGVGAYVPDYVLTNDELSRMVDTTDEWIMSRIGIKERRLLREEERRPRTWVRKPSKTCLIKRGLNRKRWIC